MLLARRGYAELNQATHGAFAFNTAAKVLAWAGVCAIVLLLLHKVRQIQLELDPVGQGLEQLQRELQSARVQVEGDEKKSESDFEGLRSRAQHLAGALDEATRQEREGSAPLLLKAQEEAHGLAEAAAQEADAYKALVGEREALGKSLAEQRQTMEKSLVEQRETMDKSLAETQAALDQSRVAAASQVPLLMDGGAAASASLRALSETAQRGSQAVDGSLARLKLDELADRTAALQRSLTELQRKVDRLSASLVLPPPPTPAAPVHRAAIHPLSAAQ